MRTRHIVSAAASALLALPLVAGTASAAAPDNDSPAGATVLTSLPATITQDTSEATTEPLDADYNLWCEAPATEASVWFRFTDTDGGALSVHLEGTDYSAGVMIIAGDPADGGRPAWCSPHTATVMTYPGETYWIMAFADTPGATGGTLVASFEEVAPLPPIDLSVDPVALALMDGSLRLSGTYTCSGLPYEGLLVADAAQKVGRFEIQGYGFMDGLDCDGTQHDWTLDVLPDNGTFSGGKAATVAFAATCGEFVCTSTTTTQTVQVRRGPE